MALHKEIRSLQLWEATLGVSVNSYPGCIPYVSHQCIPSALVSPANPPNIDFDGVTCASTSPGAAFVPSAQHDILVCLSPAGFGTDKLVNVTVAGQSSVGRGIVTWNYDAPVVSSIFPATGPTAGAHVTNITSDGLSYALDNPILVTVAGANFGADASAGTLWFKQPPDVSASAESTGSPVLDILVANTAIISWNHSAIVFLMPRIEYRLGYVGAGTNLRVTTVIGGQSSATSASSLLVQFNYEPPSVQRVQRYDIPASQCDDRTTCFKFGQSRTCKLVPADCYGTEVGMVLSMYFGFVPVAYLLQYVGSISSCCRW